MNTVDKIREGQIQLDNLEHYKPLERPMVVETSLRVQQLVKELHEHNFIDDMTNNWFCQTPNPPRTPVLYTLTKIQKPTPVGRPIISGCDGRTERLSAFVAASSTGFPKFGAWWDEAASTPVAHYSGESGGEGSNGKGREENGEGPLASIEEFFDDSVSDLEVSIGQIFVKLAN